MNKKGFHVVEGNEEFKWQSKLHISTIDTEQIDVCLDRSIISSPNI